MPSHPAWTQGSEPLEQCSLYSVPARVRSGALLSSPRKEMSNTRWLYASEASGLPQRSTMLTVSANQPRCYRCCGVVSPSHAVTQEDLKVTSSAVPSQNVTLKPGSRENKFSRPARRAKSNLSIRFHVFRNHSNKLAPSESEVRLTYHNDLQYSMYIEEDLQSCSVVCLWGSMVCLFTGSFLLLLNLYPRETY
jgi:hypothetical protein